MSIRNELQNIISGNGSVRNGDTIQAITSFLRRKKESVPESEKEKYNKAEETKDKLKKHNPVIIPKRDNVV